MNQDTGPQRSQEVQFLRLDVWDLSCEEVIGIQIENWGIISHIYKEDQSFCCSHFLIRRLNVFTSEICARGYKEF